jgi:glutamate formiminotransferase / 5-formyltetrahydrofolate cyclo-ligase
MRDLVECVPNVSAARDAAVVDALAASVTSVAGAVLLDRTSDADHNRTVLTVAGPAASVEAAMLALTAEALARIDMRAHTGQHPRLGAVDVVPFVPLGDTTMDDAVALARRFGERIAASHGLPVFLYAEAASRPGRRVLADVRRPQFEGLAEALLAPDGEPDFGPARPHPTAGATVVGARPFLIAWNIDLRTPDRDLARRIAKAVRERDGGLPRVQALGLFLEETGRAQVSMNLLDHRVTPFWRVWERVSELAASEGTEVHDSELIGLAPEAAFLDVAEHIGVEPGVERHARLAEAAGWLRMRGFRPDMALELRLAQALGEEDPA